MCVRIGHGILVSPHGFADQFPRQPHSHHAQGVPDRLGLGKILRYFLDFRYERTVMRLQHRLGILQKRIHILDGFNILFLDLDKAIKIIRSARSRLEAEQGLKQYFDWTTSKWKRSWRCGCTGSWAWK